MVPFVFAFYPVILIVSDSGVPFDLLSFMSILLRLIITIYLISSAVIGFDQRRLPAWEIILRLSLGLLIIFTNPFIHWTAAAGSIIFLSWHFLNYRVSKLWVIQLNEKHVTKLYFAIDVLKGEYIKPLELELWIIPK